MSYTKGLTAKGVPPLPFFVIVLRFVVLVLSLGVLIASGVALSAWSGYYYGAYSGPPGFMIFITIKTMIILGATMAIEKWAPHVYYRLAVIIAYALNIVFWLSGWAWSASVAALWLGYSYGYSYETRFGGGMAAGAGLGALAWVCMIVILVFFVRACIHDPEGTGVAAQTGAELGNVKQEANVSTEPIQYGQAQPAYAPQPQYQYGQAQPNPYGPPN